MIPAFIVKREDICVSRSAHPYGGRGERIIATGHELPGRGDVSFTVARLLACTELATCPVITLEWDYGFMRILGDENRLPFATIDVIAIMKGATHVLRVLVESLAPFFVAEPKTIFAPLCYHGPRLPGGRWSPHTGYREDVHLARLALLYGTEQAQPSPVANPTGGA